MGLTESLLSRLGSRFALIGTIAVALAHQAMAAPMLDAKAEYALAEQAESQGKWDAALLHYENVYDSTPTTPEQRVALRRKFLELHSKVQPNTDPAKAGVFRIKVYVFRTLDVQRTVDGKEVRTTNTYPDSAIEEIRAVDESFTKQVWEHTLGGLRVEWDLTVIEEPLTKVDGWPDPGNCAPHFRDLEPGKYDVVMVYAPMENVEPWALWGGTIGRIPEAKGAMYIGINDKSAGFSRNPTAEVQIHEWLHAVHMVVDDVQGYPPGLMVTSDCGGKCSGKDGLTCWEGKPNEGAPGWMPLYYHLIDCHLTRRMWRELTTLRHVDNAWSDLTCRSFLLLGPLDPAGAANYGLDTAFIDEEAAQPREGDEAGGLRWRSVTTDERALDITAHCKPTDNRVAYVAVYVRSAEARNAEVRVGTDDSCKLWQDGKLLLTDAELQGVQFDHHKVSVRLREGTDLFLLKVANAGGGWQAIFRVCDPDGMPLPGVEYRTHP